AQELRGVTFSRPLALHEQRFETLQLVATPGESGEWSLQVLSRDRGREDARWELHATAQAGSRGAVGGNGLSGREGPGLLDGPVGGGAFYDDLQTRGIHLGPGFRWIERIWRRDGQAVCQMRPLEPKGGAAFPSGLMDACFQALGTAPSGGAAGGEVYLPI